MKGTGLDRVPPPPAIRAFVLPAGVAPTDVVRIAQTEGPDLEYPVFDEAAGRELFESLREAGRRARARPVAERVAALGAAGERLLDRDTPEVRAAIPLLAENARLSEGAAAEVLAAMASDWTRPRLRVLVASEFAHGGLDFESDAVRADPDSGVVRRRVSAPGLITTICSGTVPGVSTTAAIRSLLVGSGSLLKPGAGDVVLTTLFAEVLREIDPGLADALAVAYWPGGNATLEDEALHASDRVVVYGGDETVRSVRTRAAASATLVEYRHRIGVAVVDVTGMGASPEADGSGEELRSEPRSEPRPGSHTEPPTEPGEEPAEEPRPERIAAAVADSVVPYEQRGCVSPARIFAIGSPDDGRVLCRAVARALEQRERGTPSRRTREEASACQQFVGSLELRRAAGEHVDVWAGRGWAVALDPDGDPFAGGRVVVVTPLADIADLEVELERYRGRLQAVGVAGLSGGREALVARWSADAGASRVGPLDRIAYPPPWWMHDGRGPLRALVDLVEWEATTQ